MLTLSTSNQVTENPIRQLKQIREQLKELAVMEDMVKDRIHAILGSQDSLTIDGYTAIVKLAERANLDKKSLANEVGADVIARHTTKKAYVTLILN